MYELELLKAPFAVEQLKWRAGNRSNWDAKTKQPKDPNKPVKVNMLIYVDSRDVQDRLDEVFGCDWSDDYKEVAGRLVCTITHNGISKSDGAGDTDFEAEKGGLSDAFKRAAVKWGVGRYLYDASRFNTWVEFKGSDFKLYEDNKEQLDAVAGMLGDNVKTYHLFLNLVDAAKTKDELADVVKKARKKAKIERWNMGNMETLKKHIETKKKELGDEQEDGNTGIS